MPTFCNRALRISEDLWKKQIERVSTARRWGDTRTEDGAGGGESQRPPEAAPPGEGSASTAQGKLLSTRRRTEETPGEVQVLPKESCPRKHAMRRPGELNLDPGKRCTPGTCWRSKYDRFSNGMPPRRLHCRRPVVGAGGGKLEHGNASRTSHQLRFL